MTDLFLAGEYLFKIADKNYADIYCLGYNRLLSYDYQSKLTNKLIKGINVMEIYLAGANSNGHAKGASYLLYDGFNCLLSFARSDERGQANKIGEKESMMELYCVGPEKSNIMAVASEELGHNMLFSYFDRKAVDKYRDMVASHGKLFIDSGAFSAWTLGKVINVDEYIKWINDRADYIDLYGQVDVIPGDRNSGRLPTPEEVREAAQKTWENYLYMRPKMKKPEGLLYTFHVGEPIEFLKQALEWTDENGNHIPYIALGGMVGKTVEVRDRFLKQCFEAIEKSSNPNVKVHAFGMTDRNLLMKYPITSADSTSWIMTGAVGSIMSDVGTITVSSQQINLATHYSHLPKDALKQFEESIKEYGFTLDELAESRDKRIMHNARYMKKKFAEIEYKPAVKKRKLF